MTKTLNQIIFFFSTIIRIFFSATLGIRIFLQKKNITPPCKLNGRSLTMLPTLITKDSILSNFDPCRRHLLDLYTMYICRHGPLVQAIFRRCRAQLFSVNTCSVLLCVLKQTRVENSSPGPILSNCCNQLKASPGFCHSVIFNRGLICSCVSVGCCTCRYKHFFYRFPQFVDFI